METKHNAIRRALEQAPGTRLPDGFAARLMERLQRESQRRERRETRLLAAAGIVCLLALVAGTACYFWYEPGVGVRLPDFHLPALPGLSEYFALPESPAPDSGGHLPRLYIFVAMSFLGFSGLDLYLRRRRRNRMHTGAPRR